ncbi:hypothetical protein AMTR_s00037p00185320 [Amborella trichopoda]|uniref:Uncharacterized protein n=1 Tax=Amborella trichopoda TaxID=13333 RepID=U5D570_AMBTC|nr:hypothetical protein AMTR_s00037p00185320 [Amborella trichopoda]
MAMPSNSYGKEHSEITWVHSDHDKDVADPSTFNRRFFREKMAGKKLEEDEPEAFEVDRFIQGLNPNATGHIQEAFWMGYDGGGNKSVDRALKEDRISECY